MSASDKENVYEHAARTFDFVMYSIYLCCLNMTSFVETSSLLGNTYNYVQILWFRSLLLNIKSVKTTAI
jgi:hypothetical protein